jgi:NADH dehydrogenase
MSTSWWTRNLWITTAGRSHLGMDGTHINTHTLIWTAGVRSAEITDRLGVPAGSRWAVRVEPTLQLPEHPEVFIIGDSAYLENGKGQPLPMLATVAQQEAKAAARNIQNILKGQAPEAFHYKDPGCSPQLDVMPRWRGSGGSPSVGSSPG